MLVYPAVDIAKGRCVRLIQGRPDREKVYYDRPVDAALHWQGLGARSLHVVDLDGALASGLRQASAADAGAQEPAQDGSQARPVLEILERAGIPVQVAGGLRSIYAVRSVLKAGASRAVVGTRAVKQPDWAMRLCRELPGRVVIALDARDGRLAVEGWQEVVDEGPVELACRLETGRLAAFLYTDVSRDGMLSRPNFEAIEELLAAVQTPVIASGGVASLEDIRLLGQCGADAVIVGKALYEGRFTLPEALEVAAGSPSRLAAAPEGWRR